MKIRRVFTHNRKKSFIVETAKETYEFPFALLSVKPSSSDPVISVCVDRELADQGFTYELRSGKSDSVLSDQVLDQNRESEFLRKKLLYDLSCLAQEKLKRAGISKRALARKLHTPPAQLYRLLDQSFYGKSLDQMVKLLHALGTTLQLKEVA